MLKNLILISSLLTANLLAGNIELNYAPHNIKRVAPNNMNEVFSFNSSIKDSIKSVVNISTKQRLKFQSNNPFGELFNDPFFRQFFGNGFGNTIPKERLQRSLGSGVILSSNGYIVTNAHVVENADEITVSIGDDSKEYNAKLIGKDPDSDLAVIKVDAKGLKPIKVGSSSTLLVGDVVFAIGNPFGVGQTVTQGIVSALNKSRMGINRYENFIQTDAPINPGNSGGALIDSRGALIGINAAILTRSGGNNGIGFAIPVRMVKNIVKKLVEEGKVTRGYLGIAIEDISKELQSIYNHKEGALILNVAKDTPAYKFNLKRGDLIYAINGKKIKNATDLQRIVGSFKPNEKIVLSIERDKREIEIEIVLGSRDSLTSIKANKEVMGGLFLNELTNEKASKYRIPKNTKGVLIIDVKPNSKAEKVGFQAGDIIIQIENIEIENLNSIEKALKRYKNKPKRVYINRYGRIMASVVE